MDAYSENRAVVVCGPTATGKTKLALELCRTFRGEMVGADSMQVYEGLPIGTAAPAREELAGIPAHLIGTLPPQQAFSVADYVAKATGTIREILQRDALPMICGGTGLYIESLVNGVRFTDEKTDGPTREKLLADWDERGGEAMLAQLADYDPDYATRLHPNDKKRILRALEESTRNGTTLAQRNAASRREKPPFSYLLVGLDYPGRDTLYGAINQRVDDMMAAGLLAEAEWVFQNREHFKTAAQAIGYKEFFPYFEDEQPLGACVEKLKQATRNYAKRQLTWFRRMEGIHWLDAGAKGLAETAGELVEQFLK